MIYLFFVKTIIWKKKNKKIIFKKKYKKSYYHYQTEESDFFIEISVSWNCSFKFSAVPAETSLFFEAAEILLS